MTETGERPIPEEVKPEAPVVQKAKGAIEKAWDGIKATNQEYWEIREALHKRLRWHGGGVYKHYVETMDLITKAFWGSGERSIFKRVMELNAKIQARLKGAALAFTTASADIAWNVASWPLRLFLPITKDPFKRLAILRTYTTAVERGVLGGVVVGGAQVEMGVVKGIKAGAEAAVTAPEVGVIIAKRRINKIIEHIKRPRLVVKS